METFTPITSTGYKKKHLLHLIIMLYITLYLIIAFIGQSSLLLFRHVGHIASCCFRKVLSVHIIFWGINFYFCDNTPTCILWCGLFLIGLRLFCDGWRSQNCWEYLFVAPSRKAIWEIFLRASGMWNYSILPSRKLMKKYILDNAVK